MYIHVYIYLFFIYCLFVLSSQARGYGWFDSKYVEPTLEWENLDISPDKDDQRMYRKVRAARKEESIETVIQFDAVIQ